MEGRERDVIHVTIGTLRDDGHCNGCGRMARVLTALDDPDAVPENPPVWIYMFDPDQGRGGMSIRLCKRCKQELKRVLKEGPREEP